MAADRDDACDAVYIVEHGRGKTATPSNHSTASS